MNKKEKKFLRYGIIFFSITSLLLVLFQLGVYLKLCQFPNFLSINMLMLYVALVWPLLMLKVHKKLQIIMAIIYLVYFAIVAGAFLEAMMNPNVNCTGIIHLTMDEFLGLTNQS